MKIMLIEVEAIEQLEAQGVKETIRRLMKYINIL